MARSRRTIVKNIHRVYTYGDFLGALSFGGKIPRSGDFICIQLAIRECNKMKAGGLLYIGVLFAALEVEKKTGFITYKILEQVYGKAMSSKVIAHLFNVGLLERVPFPETFSHIKRRVKCYKVSDKGHKCIRLFRDTYNLYQREVRRAKVNSAEGLK